MEFDNPSLNATPEAFMDASLVVTVFAVLVLVIAAVSVIVHHRRENHRAELLRNLDHHDWCRWTRSRH
ncbi:hypothetical protein ACFPTO_01530 [Paraburkholderia denitrificans]|uniref:Uncharacterized protein n=1 Tax=Paraburkholderia denitrificans TaxID=694025 RepID=A0ABW0J3B3_9BURK